MDACNEVRLVGRLSRDAVEVTLPSGDRLTSFTLVVERGRAARPAAEGRRAVTVDSLQCVVWVPRLQRAAQSWASGDVLEVQGALRRRFWRAGGAPSSLYEVEVSSAKRVAKAA